MKTRSLTHIAIIGPNAAAADLLDYARRAVRRAHQLGWIVLVGDRPRGIDRAVVQEGVRLEAAVVVVGLGDFPRNGQHTFGRYLKADRDLYRAAGGTLLDGYTVRDRCLIDQAQHCLFVWDGRDPSVERAHAYAVQRGKTAHLVNFDRSPQL